MTTFTISGNSAEELTEAAIKWLKLQDYEFYGYAVIGSTEQHAEIEEE